MMIKFQLLFVSSVDLLWSSNREENILSDFTLGSPGSPVVRHWDVDGINDLSAKTLERLFVHRLPIYFDPLLPKLSTSPSASSGVNITLSE